MGSWKSKFVFLLIIYFAGFATAIYCLAPVDESQLNMGYSSGSSDKNFFSSAFKSDEFAKSFSVELHKFMAIAKEKAKSTNELIKQKMQEGKVDI